jgi:hypothetical protein
MLSARPMASYTSVDYKTSEGGLLRVRVMVVVVSLGGKHASAFPLYICTPTELIERTVVRLGCWEGGWGEGMCLVEERGTIWPEMKSRIRVCYEKNNKI